MTPPTKFLGRVCAECGSDALEMRPIVAGYWRKECTSCGSTGPFAPAGRARPDFDPRLDYPERYVDGPV